MRITPQTATNYNNLAVYLGTQGKVAESQPLLQKALEIRRKMLGEDHPDTADIYNNLAGDLDVQGKHIEAEPLYRKALAIFRKVMGEGHPDTAACYINVAYNLNAQGKYSEAESLNRKALAIFSKVMGEGHPHTATSYGNLAFNLHAQGNTVEAMTFLKRGIQAHEASRLIGATGIDRASLDDFNPRLLLAAIQTQSHPRTAWTSVEMSLARGLLDQYVSPTVTVLTDGERVEHSQQLSSLAEAQARILMLVTKSELTAEENQKLERLYGQRRAAEERLAALAVEVSQRAVANPEAICKTLSADAALLVWIDVSGKSGNTQQHWACLVRPTGEPKWERLQGTGAWRSWSKNDSTLPRQFRDALAKNASATDVDALAKRLHAQRIAPILKHLDGVKSLYVVPVHEMAGVPIEVLAPEFTVSYVPSGTFLARRKDKAKPAGDRLLAVGDPVFLPLEKAKPAGPLPPGGLLITQVVPGGPAANARLQPDDVILKYAGIELKTVEDLGKAIADKAAEKTIEVTLWRDGKENKRDLPAGKLGIVLAKEPAPDTLAAKRKTDEMLARVRGGNWDELPGTCAEIAGLRTLLGERATLMTRSNAAEQELDAMRKDNKLAGYRYLHFATHGKANNVRAFDSALILAQDKLPKDPLPKAGEPFLNGELAASEVLEFWKLDSELVTLSACETAIGKSGGGDGMLGFAQAFLLAGSRAVCLSLWKVDDTATALLMDRFYRNLLGKREDGAKPMGKAAALHEAKVWLRTLPATDALARLGQLTDGVVRGERPAREVMPKPVVPKDAPADYKPYAHPRYWAAFILIGDPD